MAQRYDELTRVEQTQARTRTQNRPSNSPYGQLVNYFFRYIFGFFCINPRSMLNRGTNTG